MIEEVAHRVQALTLEDLSPAARSRLKLCVLANLAVAVAGVASCRLPSPAVPDGRYPVFAGGGAADARSAAFYNAACMHARTQDDFDPIGNLHVGTVVLPALLALVPDVALSGRRFLEAVAAGYMVAVGLSRPLSPVTTPRGFRSTGYFSPFGATAAVARARGLDVDSTAQALALTTAFAAGTTQAWLDGSDEWQLHPAVGADAGLRAADLAMAGLRGGRHALDGPSGLWAALTGAPPDTDGPSAAFEPSRPLEESVIKRYPVSGICQSVVLAALRLRAELGETAPVRRVEVEMNPFELGYPGTRNRGPELGSFGERLMSAAFCAAAALSRGRLLLGDFHGTDDPERDRLMEATDVVAAAGRPMLSARVSVRLANGRSLHAECRESRTELALDWSSIESWGRDLWQECGRAPEGFMAIADAVRTLEGLARMGFAPDSPSLLIPR